MGKKQDNNYIPLEVLTLVERGILIQNKEDFFKFSIQGREGVNFKWHNTINKAAWIHLDLPTKVVALPQLLKLIELEN